MKPKQRSQKFDSQIERIFLRRSSSAYGSMKKRAAKMVTYLPFDLMEFRFWLRDKFGVNGEARCEYSGQMILIEDFSVDHRNPLARGGSFALSNLALCAEKQNLRKGIMGYQEYRDFTLHVSHYPMEVQESIWRKLEIGDVQRFSYFRRKNKTRGGTR